jgi:hypothetical protein
MTDRFYQVLGVIVGAGMFVGGLVLSTGDEVKCGQRVMRPGDVCTTVKGGSVTERSYEEQRSADNRIYIAGMIIGPIVAVGSLVVFRRGGGGGGGRRLPQRPGDPAIPPMFRRAPHPPRPRFQRTLNERAMEQGYPPPYPEQLPPGHPYLQQQHQQPPHGPAHGGQPPYPPQQPPHGGQPPYPPHGGQPPYPPQQPPYGGQPPQPPYGQQPGPYGH